MAFIKLRKASETGQEVGTVVVNTDQIVAFSAGQNVTELQMADGRPRWVSDSPDEIAALAKSST
jgi:hypothetical protein